MYVTLDILRQGGACNDGYERVLEYFTTILKNKDQRIPIWALLLSGGGGDLEWVLAQGLVIDEKEFEDFHNKALLWVFESKLKGVSLTMIKKSIPKSKKKGLYTDLLDALVEVQGAKENKETLVRNLGREVLRLRQAAFLNHDSLENLLVRMNAVFPTTAKEKAEFILAVWELCESNGKGNDPHDHHPSVRQQIRRLRSNIDDLESEDEVDEDAVLELRKQIAELDKPLVISREPHSDGRHPIDWKLKPIDRFVSFFNIDDFFNQLPTKHGVNVGKNILGDLINHTERLMIVSEAGKMTHGVFVTSDPRMIHRIDRILSRFSKTFHEDNC